MLWEKEYRKHDPAAKEGWGVGVSPNIQSILIGFGFVSWYWYKYILWIYMIIRHFFIDFVMFQNNKVPRIVSPFNGTLSIT